MPTFLMTNPAPKNSTGSPAATAASTAWFEQLSTHPADRRNPVFERRTLVNSRPDTELGGHTLLAAETLDEAVARAEGCPLLADGGGVEVGTLTLLNSGLRAGDR